MEPKKERPKTKVQKQKETKGSELKMQERPKPKMSLRSFAEASSTPNEFVPVPPPFAPKSLSEVYAISEAIASKMQMSKQVNSQIDDVLQDEDVKQEQEEKNLTPVDLVEKFKRYMQQRQEQEISESKQRHTK